MQGAASRFLFTSRDTCTFNFVKHLSNDSRKIAIIIMAILAIIVRTVIKATVLMIVMVVIKDKSNLL